MDAVTHVATILRAEIDPIPVDTEQLHSRALSENRYVYLEQQPGTSPRAGLLDNQRLDIVCYGQGGRAAVLEFAQSLITVLRRAWRAQTVTEAGWIRSFLVDVSPYPQALAGIPAGTTRVTSTYTVRMREPWRE